MIVEHVKIPHFEEFSGVARRTIQLSSGLIAPGKPRAYRRQIKGVRIGHGCRHDADLAWSNMEATTPSTITRIPILLLTGFLGSGKTTLLRSLLSGTDATDTAVIVNEFGAVGLDHHLLVGASETTFVLENGCVCCSVRDDLEASLEELFWHRLRREVPRFSRVVVETTGLAEPDRVLDLFRDGSLVKERFKWASVVATIDGVTGVSTIDRFPEAFAQATGADTLIITKTDLAPTDALEQRLRLLNPRAEILRSAKGALTVPLDRLMQPAEPTTERTKRPPSITPPPSAPITSHWLRFVAPIRRADFEAAFATLRDRFGSRIVRAKGLVAFVGDEALAIAQYVSGSDLQIESGALAKDKSRASGLVVFTTAVDDHDLIDVFAAAGIPVEAGGGGSHNHHHDHAHDVDVKTPATE